MHGFLGRRREKKAFATQILLLIQLRRDCLLLHQAVLLGAVLLLGLESAGAKWSVGIITPLHFPALSLLTPISGIDSSAGW